MIKEVGFRRNRWNEIFNSYGRGGCLDRSGWANLHLEI